MKKKIFLFSILICFLFSSCFYNYSEYYQNKYFEFTVINNTDQFINFSIIEGTTDCINAKDFYSQYHNYLCDFTGDVMHKQVIAPAGSLSSDGKDLLDRWTYYVYKGSYNVTIFVCKDNTYTSYEDVYINKKYFVLSGTKTIIIGSTGNIY